MFIQRIQSIAFSSAQPSSQHLPNTCSKAHSLYDLMAHTEGAAVSIGNFDGVHIGHQTILKQMVSYARAHQMASVVVTFHPHPRSFFSRQQQKGTEVPQIGSFYDKYQWIKELGVDALIILEFDTAFAEISARDFVESLLIQKLQLKHLFIGSDFQFGKNRAGNIDFLQRHAAQWNITVHLTDLLLDHASNQIISSSAIREALKRHDLSGARKMLGRPVSLSGKVIHGAKLGRTIGYPTLNLRPPYPFALPNGIYAVHVHSVDTGKLAGVASLGIRPTIGDNLHLLLEVYLLEYSGELYGKRMHVEFLTFLREEKKFDSLETLQLAIATDVTQAQSYFNLLN